MSEIQSERASQAQELRDLQESYRKKRQALEEDAQTDLQRTRKDNAAKLRDESINGEAAVSHVRATSKEKLESLRNEADKTITYERNALSKRYQGTKQSGDSQIQTLNENLDARKDQVQKNASVVAKQETELRARESSLTNTIAQEQAAKRAKILATEQESLNQAHAKAQEQKAKLNDQSKREVSQISEQNRKEIEQLRENHHETFEKQASWSGQQLRRQSDENSKRIEQQRKEYSQNQAALHNEVQTEIQSEREESTERLKKMSAQNDQEVLRERDKGVKNLEQTRGYYDKNIAKIHKTGDEKVAYEKQLQENKVRTVKTNDKLELEELRTEHAEQLKERDLQYQDEKEQVKAFQHQSLAQQRREYDEAFHKNMKSFEETVKRQREDLRHTLMREKKEVTEDVGKYSSKKGDPFYRITQPKAELGETGDHYVVKTRVPEHEKDNVKITVKDDKVVVHGSRRFEDNIEDEEGRLATNSYQTFRQEIPLEHPVREKYLQKSYQDGVLTVKIPKA